MMFVSFNSKMTGATRGAQTNYLTGAPEFTHTLVFSGVRVSLVFSSGKREKCQDTTGITRSRKSNNGYYCFQTVIVKGLVVVVFNATFNNISAISWLLLLRRMTMTCICNVIPCPMNST